MLRILAKSLWPASIALLASTVAVTGQISAFAGPKEQTRLSFDLPDLEGNRHRLDDYRGQVLLVNFWASWCAPCIVEMPSLQHLSESRDDQPFRVLTVNSDEPARQIKETFRRYRLNLTVLLDRKRRIRDRWGVNMLPASFLIGRDGRIRYTALGEIDWDSQEMQTFIDELIKESM